MNIIGRSYMRITSENERVYLFSEQGNLTIKRERERERERGGVGGRGKCIFKQEKHLLFKMSAVSIIQGEMLMKVWVNLSI